MRRTGTLYIVAVRHRILGNVINMVHAFRQSPHHQGKAFVTLQKVGISEALLGIVGERLRSLGGGTSNPLYSVFPTTLYAKYVTDLSLSHVFLSRHQSIEEKPCVLAYSSLRRANPAHS